MIRFPFLFGGTFIEGPRLHGQCDPRAGDFPSFSEGLSLRAAGRFAVPRAVAFPFLFGGTFIEGFVNVLGVGAALISLPFRRDFH